MSTMQKDESGMEGPLSKWTNVMKGWQYRWFVLDHQTGLLSYYTSKEKMKRGSRRGCVRLRGAVIGIDDEDDSTFTITCDQKTFHFQARNADEREQWVRGLEETILRHSQPLQGGFDFPTVAELIYPRVAKIIFPSDEKKTTQRDQQVNKTATSSRRRGSASKTPVQDDSIVTLPSVSTIPDKTLECMHRKPPVVSSLLDVDVDDYVVILCPDEELMRWRRDRSKSQPPSVATINEEFGVVPSNKPIPTVQEFDRKLAEADAYLQILIEQVGLLETRIDKFEDETQHQKHDALRDSAKAMIESIKQAIVLLQLAKYTIRWPSSKVSSPLNSGLIGLLRESRKHSPLLIDNQLNPVNGLIQPEVDGIQQDETTNRISRLSEGHPDSISIADSVASVDSAAECLETNGTNGTATASQGGSDRVAIPVSKPRALGEQIPALSYSSSDDEDFFDADEFHDEMSPSQTTPGQADGKMAAARGAQQQDDFIAMADSDDEVLDCGDHGSVITHLLSQVRLGMDLTRVVLPTFILERRSLLEMYADFFAHPELFATISKLDDPKERMLQVTRWYVSAFHAGRKGSVAKKPYNPIQGETFLCHWDLEETDSSSNGTNAAHEELLQDGPVPWASPDQVTFVAEQVSHHPPISAFYAEHVRNKMSFNAHIWTKSKFLGLSIGVEMVGQACVSDLIHEEEYIITFPNGYGRSILTIPWFEMGGKCSITCAKTGYSAQVVFHTKPFYGGKRNRISVEVQHVSDRRPALSVQGDWTGSMTGTSPDEPEEQVFVDTTAMKINKKKVRPLEKQDEYESRRLWKDVTHNLKIKDIEKATDAKHFLEERQRQGAKERRETGTAWETKLFHEDGECWIYDNPLQLRLDRQAEREQSSLSTSTNTTSPSNTSGSSGIAATNPDRTPAQQQDLLS